MIEISRTQDEEVGDGTTSVIILAGEVLSIAEPFLEQKMHPTVIIQSFRMALDDIIMLCHDKLSVRLIFHKILKLNELFAVVLERK